MAAKSRSKSHPFLTQQIMYISYGMLSMRQVLLNIESDQIHTRTLAGEAQRELQEEIVWSMRSLIVLRSLPRRALISCPYSAHRDDCWTLHG